MKVLIVTAMYPNPGNPAYGSFVRTQVEFLRGQGIEAEVLVLQGPPVVKHIAGVFQLRQRLADGSFDLVHAHFGYAGVVARMQWKVPVVVTFHGDDLLGQINERGRPTLLSRVLARLCAALAGYVDAVIVQSAQMAGKLGL